MVRIAICDDSKVDSTIINEFLTEYIRERNVEADIRIFNHPDKLLTECETFRPHIFILDIVMPMLTGIEAAKELRFTQKESQIIFTTSDPAFALESFQVNPTNYLLKPVEKEKLFDSLDMCMRRVDSDTNKTITIKVRGGFETAYLEDLMYVDYRNHVVTFHLKNGDEISTPTLRIGFAEYLKTNLSDIGLVQCHESIAVNINAVDKLTKESIELRNKEVVPVSKSKYKLVLEKYLKQGE